MHKKLKAELDALAHSILTLENNDDIEVLHKKALEIYEKLTVLKFVLGSFEQTSQVTLQPSEINKKSSEVVVALEDNLATEIVFEPETSEKSIDKITVDEINDKVDTNSAINATQISLEEEFKDAISADVATNLFEKVTKEHPIAPKPTIDEPKKRSLNDALYSTNIQVGLNDRIAFVKYLFDGSQEDFNRVLSQLNSFTSFDEAMLFLNEIVKPDYNWAHKEEYENRLINIIERKFL